MITEKKTKITVALLCGGRNSRMGKNKALLPLDGKTFLDRLIFEFGCFDEIILSAGERGSYEDVLLSDFPKSQYSLKIIFDENLGLGPLEALRRVLSEARNDFVFVCACDMPFASKKIPEYLQEFFSSDYQVYVPTVCGKTEPLCAFYKKSVLQFVENQVQKNDLKISRLFELVPTKFISVEKSSLDKNFFLNVNTPQEYAALQKPFVFCVSGLKNSGKTRMICSLLTEAKSRGYTCAVIKHDGHDCFSDAPQTDTYYFSEHGAVSTAVFSENRFMFFANEQIDAETLIEKIKSLSNPPDFIIIEGLKDSDFPKIEVMRKEISEKSVCKEPLICIAKDDYRPEEIFDSIEEKRWLWFGMPSCIQSGLQSAKSSRL